MSYDDEMGYQREMARLKDEGEQMRNDELYAMDSSNWETVIDGKFVTKTQLINAYRFWVQYHTTGTETCCPMCGADLDEQGMFVCHECGEIKEKFDLCTEHSHDYDICTDCCSSCGIERAKEDAYNRLIDEKRGK